MPHFKNILVVVEAQVDASTLLARVAALAQATSAQLTVVDVIESLPSLPPPVSLPAAQFQQIAADERRLALEHAVEPLAQANLSVTVKILFGTPFLAIIREVLRYDYDLLIKAAQDQGTATRLLFGSTDRHLMRKCPCPVWVVKPGVGRPYRRLLVAVDPDPHDPQQQALSRKLLDLAVGLTRQEGAELHIVHGWQTLDEKLLRGPRLGLSDPEVNQVIGAVLNTHIGNFDRLLDGADLAGVRYREHLLRGDPGAVIAGLARDQAVELVIIGTVARTGIPGFIIGNTAERVLAEVDCAVLAVKPDGFVTPVTLTDADG